MTRLAFFSSGTMHAVGDDLSKTLCGRALPDGVAAQTFEEADGRTWKKECSVCQRVWREGV